MLDTTYILRVHWLRMPNHHDVLDRNHESLPFGYRHIEAFPYLYLNQIEG